MKNLFLIVFLLLTFTVTSRAQETVFVPNCGGDNDTARFTAIITRIGTNTGTIRLPYKDGIRCAVSSLTIPENITLDNSDGTGISARSSATLLVLGPVVNPIGKPMFFGPGVVSFTGNTHIGAVGQARLSDGNGGETWGDVSGGGGGIGPTTGTGAVVLQTNPTIIGAALTGTTTATSINKVAITPPATGATLTIADGKTLTAASTLNLSGTDGTSVIFGQPLTVGGSGGVTLTGGGTLNFGGFTGTVPATGNFAMGAASVSVNSTNNATLSNHTHAIASSSNPGASASVLASDPDGYLQLVRLGIGTAPSQPLEVAGNVYVNAPTANLFMKDIATGLRSSTSTVLNPQPNNSICTTNFTSGLVGWCIRDVGNAEFENVDVRGAIHASVFVYNALQATAGTFGVFKSAAKLRTDVTIPSGPTYGTSVVNVDVVDQEGITHAASQLFATGDILRLKDGLVGDTWLRVASASDQTTFWRYSATIMAGSANATYRAGLGVADYGASGQGFIIQTADQTNSPYLQMATHGASFTSLNSAGTLAVTPRLRLGNCNGSYGYIADVYCFGTGQYGTAGQSWLTVDPVNGVRIGNNTTVLTQIDAAGNASFSGAITATGGTIAGWAIGSTAITSGVVKVASSLDIAASEAHLWVGKQASNSVVGIDVRDVSNRYIQLIGNNGSLRPYLSTFDGTHTRVAIGELNISFPGTNDGATNAMGLKVWNSSGDVLAQFSDSVNKIGGWTVSPTTITGVSGNVILDSANGISITGANGFTSNRAYRVIDGSSNTVSALWTDLPGAGTNRTHLEASSVAATSNDMFIDAKAPTGQQAQIFLNAEVNGTTTARVDVSSLQGITLRVGSSNTVTVDTNNNISLGASSMSTTATDGFVYIRTTAGPPTGVPTSKTGRVAMVYDATNDDLYIYNGGWKKTHLAP